MTLEPLVRHAMITVTRVTATHSRYVSTDALVTAGHAMMTAWSSSLGSAPEEEGMEEITGEARDDAGMTLDRAIRSIPALHPPSLHSPLYGRVQREGRVEPLLSPPLSPSPYFSLSFGIMARRTNAVTP